MDNISKNGTNQNDGTKKALPRAKEGLTVYACKTLLHDFEKKKKFLQLRRNSQGIKVSQVPRTYCSIGTLTIAEAKITHEIY